LKSYDDCESNAEAKSQNDYSSSVEEKKETFGVIHDSSDTKNYIYTEKGESESEMRGVHAKVNIAPNTVCVSIPKKCLITVEMGQSTEIGQIILRSNLDLDAPKHIFLMIFLLWDRKVQGNKSFFKPYYDVLPQTLRNIPIFWSLAELEYLKGSYLLTQIVDRKEAIADDYYAICQVAPGLKEIATLEEFQWARMCVCSRNFGLQINGHRTSALVPHADMFNHYRPRETKWTYDDEIQAFTITTLQRIPAGNQIYDSYGQKCNHRFLLNYGFAVEDNREMDGFCPNEVPLELCPSPEDPVYREKCDFWLRGDDDHGPSTLIVNPSSVRVSELTAAFAAAAARHSTPTAVVQSAMEAVVAVDVHRGKKNDNTAQPQRISCTTTVTAKRVRVCVSNNENTKVLFSMLRVLGCNKEELHSISSQQSLSLGNDVCPGYVARALRGISSSNPSFSQHTFYRTCRDIRHPISLENERAAMKLLLDIVNRTLELYTCSLAQDVADLLDKNSYPDFSNKRHAKVQVKGEKEVLHHFALWAQTSLDVMDIIERDIAIEKAGTGDTSASSMKFDSVINAMEEEEDNGGPHHTIVRYCSGVLGAIRNEELNRIRRNKVITKNLMDSSCER